MHIKHKHIFVAIIFAVFAGAALPATAQSYAPDAVLVAKANSGDDDAQISIGEGFAAAAANEHNAAQAGEEYKQAAEWYRKAAEQGSAAGRLHLAALYRDGGKGFPRDLAQTVAWYRQAADLGDVTAQGALGVLYSFGQGVQQNYVEAYFWLDLAASANDANHDKYAANRQLVGTHITADELEEVQDRIARWKAAHAQGHKANN
jgi:uncharacterized protein